MVGVRGPFPYEKIVALAFGNRFVVDETSVSGSDAHFRANTEMKTSDMYSLTSVCIFTAS